MTDPFSFHYLIASFCLFPKAVYVHRPPQFDLSAALKKHKFRDHKRLRQRLQGLGIAPSSTSTSEPALETTPKPRTQPAFKTDEDVFYFNEYADYEGSTESDEDYKAD